MFTTKSTQETGSEAGLSEWRKFMTYAYGFPLLSEDRQVELFSRMRKDNDLKARDELIASYYKLVLKIARYYCKRNTRLTLEDLFSVGLCGLLQVIDRDDEKAFDPKQASLATYATFLIRSEILGHLRRERFGAGVMVYRPTLEKLTSLIQEGDNAVVLPGRYALSLEAPLRSKKRIFAGLDAGEETYKDQLASESNTPEQNAEQSEFKCIVKEAISNLSEREQVIIIGRYLTEPRVVLEELGNRFGVSNQRVLQIEVNILRKLEKVLSQDYGITDCGILA